MSEAPVRLRDDPGVDDRLRADLDVASRFSGAGLDVESGIERLCDAIGRSPSGGPGGGQTGGGADGAGLGGAGTAALVGAAALAIAAVVAVWQWPSTEEPDARHGSPAPAPEDDPAPARVISPPPDRAPPAEPVASQLPPTGAGAGDPGLVDDGASAPRSREPVRQPTPPAGRSDVHRELEQMVRIRALLDIDPARALALADEGRREFPDGLFAEEREAHAVLALDRLGRSAAATRRARRFLSRHPDSAFTERIRRIVEGP